MRNHEYWARRAGRRYVARKRQRIPSTPRVPTTVRCRSEARRVITSFPFIGSRSAGLLISKKGYRSWQLQRPHGNLTSKPLLVLHVEVYQLKEIWGYPSPIIRSSRSAFHVIWRRNPLAISAEK